MLIINVILLILNVTICVAVYKVPPINIVAVVLASVATTLGVVAKLYE